MPTKAFSCSTLFTLLVLLLVLSACGNPQASTQPAGQPTAVQASVQPAIQPATVQPVGSSTIDACSLLTKADAAQILGKPVEAPTQPVQGSETFNVSSCEYKLQGGTPMDNVTIIVAVPDNGDQAIALTAFDAGRRQAQAAYNATPVMVAGVGDAAYWVGGAGNNLSVMKGDINVTLSASTQKGDAPTQAILDLAKVVLGRLP